MGRPAKLLIFLLMTLLVALSRLVDVELAARRAGLAPALEIRSPDSADPRGSAVDGHARRGPGVSGTYVVQTGDTLSRIAGRVYGRSALWTAILEANRDRLRDPARLRVGSELVIPSLEEAERLSGRSAPASQAQSPTRAASNPRNP